MKSALEANARKETFSALVAKADSGDATAARRVGLTLLERQDFEKAEKYLAESKQEREKELEARVGRLSRAYKDGDHAAEAPLLRALEQSLSEFPATPDSVLRRMELAEHYKRRREPKKQKQILGEAIALAGSLARSPSKLEGHDLTPADLWSMVAQMRESLEQKAEARKAWKKAAAEYAKGASHSDERGSNLERAYCLWKAGETAAAEKIYSALEKAYPNEFTFYYAHAGMKLELKEFDSAKELASKALEHSYGDNRIRAAHLLGKVMNAQGRKKEAAEMIRGVLASTELPKDPSIRTHRYVKMLKDLQSQLQE
jgi:tetratricopeptide (TPR) repeat protein